MQYALICQLALRYKNELCQKISPLKAVSLLSMYFIINIDGH